MDDMKEALDKAAASSDQAVRNMAIRYREMRNEFEQYEAFFSIYKMGVKPNGTATSVRAPTTPKERASTPRASTSRSDRVDTFGTAIQAIFMAVGHPMKLDHIYTTYSEQHPEDQTTKETFRQRFVKRKGTITLIKGQGYWWADAPLTETVESV